MNIPTDSNEHTYNSDEPTLREIIVYTLPLSLAHEHYFCLSSSLMVPSLSISSPEHTMDLLFIHFLANTHLYLPIQSDTDYLMNIQQYIDYTIQCITLVLMALTK